MYLQSHFNTAILLINTYDGSMPLVHHLKSYFSQHKKHGSKDRKHISHLCYCYYRLGHSMLGVSIEERISLALFLCNDEAGVWSALFEGTWLKNWSKTVEERIAFVQNQHTDLVIENFFPWQEELSKGIDAEAFSLSHLIQPDLFLRIRPKHEQSVVQRLRDCEVPFKKITATALALPNSTKLDGVLGINREVVVQDYSSQRIGEFLEMVKVLIPNSQFPIKVWDCCAASGGKSILTKDVLGNIQLTVTDIRESIINNLKQRMLVACINLQQALVADISSNKPFNNQQFDLVIADVPCTGSGTWSRTPEQLQFFKPSTISEFAARQKKIASNVITSIKPNGYLLYITCSVFKKENEEVALFLQQNCQLELVKMEVITGYDKEADTMFAALLKKLS